MSENYGVQIERLEAALAAKEAEFQARLGPWVDAVKSSVDAMNMIEFTARGGDGDAVRDIANKFVAANLALLSSTDALTAQAREAEIRAEAFEEAGRRMDELPSNPRFLGELLREMAAAERAKAAKPKTWSCPKCNYFSLEEWTICSKCGADRPKEAA